MLTRLNCASSYTASLSNSLQNPPPKTVPRAAISQFTASPVAADRATCTTFGISHLTDEPRRFDSQTGPLCLLVCLPWSSAITQPRRTAGRTAHPHSASLHIIFFYFSQLYPLCFRGTIQITQSTYNLIDLQHFLFLGSRQSPIILSSFTYPWRRGARRNSIVTPRTHETQHLQRSSTTGQLLDWGLVG